MSAVIQAINLELAREVDHGLQASGQKYIPSRFFYDDLGSSLFEAITLLPEYGLTRADERLLANHFVDIAAAVGDVKTVFELGSGTGRKTRYILQSLHARSVATYLPIDVSPAALESCRLQMTDLVDVHPICADWVEGLREIKKLRAGGPVLLLFLGSSIGNLGRSDLSDFLQSIKSHLQSGDFFLIGADLVKDIETMLTAYDDPTGVTAAFNLNVLGRINRELGGDFDLRSFAHEVRWNQAERRIEMHLLSGRDQTVRIEALGKSFALQAGETIWTESSHKFEVQELDLLASENGFETVETWVDREWPFAEALWQVSR